VAPHKADIDSETDEEPSIAQSRASAWNRLTSWHRTKPIDCLKPRTAVAPHKAEYAIETDISYNSMNHPRNLDN